LSNNGTRYDVCIPRKYRDGAGNERTHFWSVGTGFGFERQTQQGTTRGVSIRLNAKMLITDEYVLFEREPEAASSEPPPDDFPI